MRVILKLLLIALFLGRGLANAVDVKPSYPSYIGEYSHWPTSKTTKVNLPKCRKINSRVFESGSNVWYILSDCDADQPKIRSIRIWRSKLEADGGTKIHAEIILPWRELHLLSEYPYMCKKKGEQEFNVVGYINLSKDMKVTRRGSIAYVPNYDGSIKLVPVTAIDSCIFGEDESALND